MRTRDKHSVARWFGVSIVVFGMLAPLGARAYTGGSANLCQVAYAGDQTQVFHDDLGAGNYSWSSIYLNCPVPWGTNGGSPSWSAALLQTADNSSTSPLGCWIYKTMYSGSQYWSVARYTCSSTDGCPDPTSSYVGNAAIRWTGSQMGGATSSGIGNWMSAGFVCLMPPGNGSYSATSWITGYMLY